MNAADILDALRKAWPAAAIVPELEIRDEYAYANLDNPDGHDSLVRRIDASIGIVWVRADGTIEWRRKCKINHVPEPLPGIVVERLARRASQYALLRQETA